MMADTTCTKPKEIYPHPGGKAKSDVWKYFGFFKKDENEPPIKSNLDLTTGICKLCRKSYRNTGNTTNFRCHIEAEHTLPGSKLIPTTTSTTKKSSQPTLPFGSGSTTSGTQGHLSKERKAKIDDTLQRLIVGKILPLSLVENEHFKAFVRELDPRYTLPTRSKLLTLLEEKKQALSEKIKSDLRTVEGVGMTHDGWTSHNTESYNTTTIHYINKDWELKTATLNTKKMEGSHISEKLAESIQETKNEWCLNEVFATTDNAANEVKAFKLLQWMRFGCYGHRINLIVKKALEQPEIEKVLGKGRRLVTLYHSSSSINDYLKEKQQLLLPSKVGHKLIADVPTRWNSSLMMLTRLNEQMPALMAVAADDRVNKSAKTTMKNCLYTFDKAAKADKVIDLLQPFKTATEIMCSENVPTINKVLPLVVKLKRTVSIKEDILQHYVQLKPK